VQSSVALFCGGINLGAPGQKFLDNCNMSFLCSQVQRVQAILNSRSCHCHSIELFFQKASTYSVAGVNIGIGFQVFEDLFEVASTGSPKEASIVIGL
jgi:hypothetical protein